MEACPLRVRPIMMTTLTTVLALIPMAVGTGEGNEMLQPMGVVMISGMVIATVVTLLFTPVYYSLLDSLSERIGQPFRTRRNRKTENCWPRLPRRKERLLRWEAQNLEPVTRKIEKSPIPVQTWDGALLRDRRV